ncbi:hypothetical protein [Chryseobacterium limigenitum]|nr:hypothetical protein [Chryseobacterium limigenitum]
MTFHLFSNPDKKEVEFVVCNLGSDIFDCLKLNNENLISTGGYVIKDKAGKEIINPVLDVFKQDLANSISEIYLSKGDFNRYGLSKAKIINAIDKEIFTEYNYQKVVGFLFDEMGAPLKFFIDQFRNEFKDIEEYRLSEKSYLPDVNGFDPILNGALLKAIGVKTTIPIEKYTYSKEDLEYYQIKEKQVDWVYAINAEFCGFWNALVDTADGLAMLLPSMYQILSDRATFKQFFRVIVDFLMMTPQEVGDMLSEYDFEKSKGSIYRLSYQQCYEISMILSLFLPSPKIGKAGKAPEAIGEISAWLANFSTKNELVLLAYKMGLRVERTAGEWQLVFGKYKLLKGSKEKVLKMVEDIGEMSKFEGNQNLSNLEKQLNEAVVEENGTTRKLTKMENEELLDELLAEEKFRSLNIGDDIDDIVDVTKVPKIAEKIRNTTLLKNFDIFVIDRDNHVYSELFSKWQKSPQIEGVFFPKSGTYARYSVDVKGPKVYIFTGHTSEGYMVVKGHTLQHEIFHVEMHAKLIEQLGLEKYQKLIDKIPTHIKEEYVVHRFLKTKSKAMNNLEIQEEIKLINDRYRPKSGLDTPTTKEYLEKEWNLKNELKKIKIYY